MRKSRATRPPGRHDGLVPGPAGYHAPKCGEQRQAMGERSTARWAAPVAVLVALLPSGALAQGTCRAPGTIAPGGGIVRGTTAGVGQTSGTCNAGVAPEAIFRWTPSFTGVAIIDTCSPDTGFDTVVYVRRDSCATGAELACNDDADGGGGVCGLASRLLVPVQSGRQLFVFVDGFDDQAGAFTLSAASAPGSCGDPTPVPPEGGSFSVSPSGPSGAQGTCQQDDPPAPEQVFAWTPPFSGA